MSCVTDNVPVSPLLHRLIHNPQHSLYMTVQLVNVVSQVLQVLPQPSVVCRSDTTQFVSPHFNTKEAVGPRNILDTITTDSASEEYLSLFWDDSLWTLLVDESNRQAEYVKAAKPNNYCAKSFSPVTVEEMEAFLDAELQWSSFFIKTDT